jgi:hypothetical protein
LHNDIEADTRVTVLGIIHDAVAQADDKQDQRDFQRDRDDAYHRADRPMRQVGDYHSVHHRKTAIRDEL